MPQVVTIGSGGDYSTVASWVASSDYSTNWGVGNKATGQITGQITEAATINTATTPNGALLTSFPGEEYDETNSSTCAGLISNGITLALRDNGLEVSKIFIETTANMIALRLGAFESVDSDVHDVGVKSGLTGDSSNAIETYSAAAFTGNLERVTVEGSGGFGIWLRSDATGTLDHITIVGACANGSGFRDGFFASGASTVLTNTLVLLAATASGSAEAFAGTFNASSDFNAGDDTTAPGSNSLDNRTTADLADFAGGDFRTASASALATAGTGPTPFIGASLEVSGGEVLIIDSGDYSLSGTGLNLLAQLNVTTTAGSYTLTGTQTNLITARSLLADSGSYNLTGTDVTLIYTPSAGGDVLIIDSGVYSLAGDEVILRAGLSIIASSGDYSTTGTNTSILFNGNIITESNAYLLTGTNVNVFANYGIIAQTTSYSLTGSSVTLKYSGDTSQTIGVVTAGFAIDKYSSNFKPNTITVTFKG